MRQERSCRRRKQGEKTVEQRRLMTKDDYLNKIQSAIQFGDVLKAERFWTGSQWSELMRGIDV